MDNADSFIAMGGHAKYVWPAYAIAALVIVGVAVATWRRLRAAESALARVAEADPALSDDA
jgi:heme exporter protein D